MSRGPNLYTHALVRPPGASYVNAIATVPQPIDAVLARQQHAEYVAALRETGVQVQALEPDERYPDACFTQDPAMVIANVAIINRMGAESRVGESGTLADALGSRFALHYLTEPGTLEGGDVLNFGDYVLVGESDRTNTAGIAQLRAILAPRGIDVDSVPVHDFLHLLTVATYIGRNTVVVHEAFANNPKLQEFTRVIVPREEEYAANTLGIGDFVIMPAGYPITEERIRAAGFTALPVPMSEFYKADGGVSCLSLLW